MTDRDELEDLVDEDDGSRDVEDRLPLDPVERDNLEHALRCGWTEGGGQIRRRFEPMLRDVSERNSLRGKARRGRQSGWPC